MKRGSKNIENWDLILSSDWHIREDTPVCRVDDFYEAQWRKVSQISELQLKYDCPVIIAGDVFDHWKPSPRLISDCLTYFPDKTYVVYGQHDLPNHSLDLKYKSGINVLEKAGCVKVLKYGSWGEIPSGFNFVLNNQVQIQVRHIFNYKTVLPWPGCTSPKASKLLRQYSNTCDLIITGDNHTPFVEYYENSILVNPGSLMRQDANQIDYKPRVYLYSIEHHKVQPFYLEIEEKAVSRIHIEKVKERDERIAAFVSSLKEDKSELLSFEENLKRYIQLNNIRNSVINIIYDVIEN